MTEERFEEIIENAADRFDRSVNRAWRQPPIRFTAKALSLFTGIGLIASASALAKQGKHSAAKVCLVSGVLIIAAEAAQFFIFKRK